MRSLFIEWDKRQAEWVVCAYLAADPRMIEVIEKGLDPHVRTGQLISQLPEDLILLEHKAVGHHTDPVEIAELRSSLEPLQDFLKQGHPHFLPRNMSVRQAGKKSNHALNYDMTSRRFALENEMDQKDADSIVSLYYKAYPGIKNNMHIMVRNRLNENRTLTNCFGRKHRFLGPWGDDLFKEAYSCIPQSTVVDLVNRGMCLTYEDDTLDALRLKAQVHDSIMALHREATAKEVAYAILRVAAHLNPEMEYNHRKFYIQTDVKIGFDWGHMAEIKHNLNDDSEESISILADKLQEAEGQLKHAE